MKQFAEYIDEIINEAGAFKSKYGEPEEGVSKASLPAHFAPGTPELRGAQLPGVGGTKIQTNIAQFTYKTIQRAMWNAYEIGEDKHDRTSFIVWGMPGVGKSEILKEFGSAVKKKYYADRNQVTLVLTKGEHGVDPKSGAPRPAIVKNPDEPIAIDKLSDEEAYNHVLANLKDYFWTLDVRTAGLTVDSLLGIPKVGSEKKVSYEEYIVPAWIHICSTPGSAGILLLDEINQGERDVLNMMYSVLLDRKVGTRKFTNDVFICGAGNIGAQFEEAVRDFNPAARNRCMIGWLEATPEEWYYYAEKVNPRTQKPNVDPLVVAFVRKYPKDTFLVMPDPGAERGADQGGWPSPRMLVIFSNNFRQITHKFDQMKKGADSDYSQEAWTQEVFDVAAGLLGVKWANKFKDWLNSTAQNTSLNLDSLEKLDFDQIGTTQDVDVITKFVKGKLQQYVDVVFRGGVINKESFLDRYVRIAAKIDDAPYGTDRLRAMLEKIKDEDQDIWGQLAAKLVALRDAKVDSILERLEKRNAAV
jgi:MoxR-like ATPase